MKKINDIASVLMVAVCMLTSCLGDDDSQSVTYDDTAITAFTLGTLNRYTHRTSTTTGNDTVVKTTVTGSTYKMTIDHTRQLIYNQDSLPLGTDVAHVLTTISTKNSGVVGIKSLTSDSVRWHSATDSIDFTQPRVFRVFALSGKGYRDYEVTVNVSHTTGLTFGWEPAAASLPEDWQTVATAHISDTLLVFGRQADGMIHLYATTDGASWQAKAAFDGALWKGAVVRDHMAYVLNGTQVQRSRNLADWEPVGASVAGLSRLIGAGSQELFALTDDGQLMHLMGDEASQWEIETLDSDASLLPVTGVACVSWPYASADSTDYVLLAGQNAARDGLSSLWRKVSYYGTAEKSSGQWVYMPVDDTNHYYTLPAQAELSLVKYGGGVLALGSNLTVYLSRDQGITWRPSGTYALPASFAGSSALLATDESGRLWLLGSDGKVWIGLLR